MPKIVEIVVMLWYNTIFDSLKRVKVPQSLCLSGVGAFVVYNVKCVYTSEKEARPPLRSRRAFI